MERILKARSLCKKPLRTLVNEIKIIVVEYIVYFILDLRNIRKKNLVPYVD